MLGDLTPHRSQFHVPSLPALMPSIADFALAFTKLRSDAASPHLHAGGGERGQR
ncbi:MAG: hypothetical protein WCC60_10765 [Ilumatobacteraceae bacterium]